MTITDIVVVSLSLLPHLRRIEWWGLYSGIFRIAAKHILSIRLPCQIVEVNLHIGHRGGYEGSKGYCRSIDEALTSDNFPSLRHVLLHRLVPFDYFPLLRARGYLELCEW